MAGLERALSQPVRSRPHGNGSAWLRLGLAVAGLAALALSDLIAAQGEPRGGLRSASPEISMGEGYARWTGTTPGWRSRSQILEDAGILRRR